MDKASSYFKSSLYSAGFVSKADADAQLRCFAFLEQSLSALQREIDAGGASNTHQTSPASSVVGMLKNQQVILQSAHDIMTSFKGSFAIKKADRFWEHWDGCKKVAYEMLEGRDRSKEEFEAKMAELEDGRYLK